MTIAATPPTFSVTAGYDPGIFSFEKTTEITYRPDGSNFAERMGDAKLVDNTLLPTRVTYDSRGPRDSGQTICEGSRELADQVTQELFKLLDSSPAVTSAPIDNIKAGYFAIGVKDDETNTWRSISGPFKSADLAVQQVLDGYERVAELNDREWERWRNSHGDGRKGALL